MTKPIELIRAHRTAASSPALCPTKAARRLPGLLLGLVLATMPAIAIPSLRAQEAVSPEAAEAILNALETTLVETLNEATFIGRWHPIANGQVGDENSDQYSIAGAQKIDGNRWIIRARLRPDMPNLIIPVPLRIEWAGDTPVMIVDNFGLPGMNRYSARVLIFADTYAGTWSGGGMAGLISGVIVREQADAEPNDADAAPPAEPAPQE